MTVSMYQAAVPPLVRLLETLKHLLAKGEAHAAARQIEPSVLLGARLAPNQRPNKPLGRSGGATGRALS